VVLALALALVLPGPARAQLYGNAIPLEILRSGEGNVYFGSVRDESGGFLEDATIILDTGVIEYVAVTGVGGRFRLRLPVDVPATDVGVRCSHPGYLHARLIRRRPRGGHPTPVELSCVLG